MLSKKVRILFRNCGALFLDFSSLCTISFKTHINGIHAAGHTRFKCFAASGRIVARLATEFKARS